MLILSWLPSSNAMLAGTATVMTPAGPAVTAVTIHPCPPGMKLRKEAEPAAHSNDDGAEGEATKPDSKGDGERVANPDR